MKVGKITRTTKKGQIVIPKEFRDALRVGEGTPLHISLKEGGIYIQPVEDIVPQEDGAAAYVGILENTRGAWAGDADKSAKEEKKRKAGERKASQRMRRTW